MGGKGREGRKFQRVEQSRAEQSRAEYFGPVFFFLFLFFCVCLVHSLYCVYWSVCVCVCVYIYFIFYLVNLEVRMASGCCRIVFLGGFFFVFVREKRGRREVQKGGERKREGEGGRGRGKEGGGCMVKSMSRIIVTFLGS